jgi:tyrosine-protein kinase Etk/Wzc
MERSQNKYAVEDTLESENNLRDIFDKYKAKWYWFIIGSVVSVAIAYYSLRYTIPLYEATASILIKDEDKGGPLSELSAFEDLGTPKGFNRDKDNEISILKSRALMSLVAKELRLNISYFVKKGPVYKEVYSEPPVHISFVSGDSSVYEEGISYIISVESGTRFALKDAKGSLISEKNFGEQIETILGKIIITSDNSEIGDFIGKDIMISITPLKDVVDGYRGALQVNPSDKTSNVIEITLKDPVKEKAVDVINDLIKQRNADAIADKNQVSRNTSEFINERIKFITSELSDVESNEEDYKTKHKLVDVSSEAGLVLQTGSENETSIVEANTQLQIVEYMYTYLLQQHGDTCHLIPANLGFSDHSIETMIASYNDLVMQRNKIYDNSSAKNPAVVNLDVQLLGLKQSLKQSLYNLKQSLQIKIKQLTAEENSINSKIADVPKYEREYRVLDRQQQIKEALYLYLLQKQEETNIALAVAVGNTKIIDSAYSNGTPVYPNKKMIYLASLMLGLTLPIVGIYILGLLDTKVRGMHDMNSLNIPVIGNIPLEDSKSKLVVGEGIRTNVAEAFRLLRTNINFMLNGAQDKGQAIFITSTIGKEGKTFISINLAATLAISGKKVLLIGMDLRSPKILDYLGLQNVQGLTNYITNRNLVFNNVVCKMPGIEGVDVIPSGPIPPNPAELLMNDRLKELLNEAKERYDYIIIDTAPAGMVTDTLLLSDYADLFIYVVRAHFLDRRLLRLPEAYYKEKRLKNMAILVNSTDHKKGYGYGYGYGYGQEEPKPWWKRIL